MMTERLQVVAQIAREGGALALSLRSDLRSEVKPDGSIVTNADIAVQELLVTRLTQAFPGVGLVGEESGLSRQEAEGPTFAIDPIDGTDSYHRGFPHFGVSIGLVEAERCTMGVFYNPALDLLWAADAGRATCNGHVLEASTGSARKIERLLLAPSDFHRYYTTAFSGKIRGYGSVAQHLCYVASGQATAALAFRSHIWDLAGSIAILDAAGCRYAGLDGTAFPARRYLNGEKIMDTYLASRPDIWDEMAACFEPK